jgi:cyclopropane-fatty-acyl-phospholipid synthase
MLTLLPSSTVAATARSWLADKLRQADIVLDGSRPWDLQVHDERSFRRVLTQGSLGLGESFVDGWWDCADLSGFFTRLLRARIDEAAPVPRRLFSLLSSHLLNPQRPSRVGEVARRHYDLDPELFRAMLGEDRVYSCGYWRTAATLEEAQRAKIDLVCRKLGLTPGMRVLDVGCGWGAAAFHAATHYGVEVTGITISREQAVVARERCRGLPVDIRLQDYREVAGCYDRIFSIGMFEHVGPRNYATYMRAMRARLRGDGLFLLHTIGSDRSTDSLDPWLERYIFPNAVIPSARQITAAAEGSFQLEDWHAFGPDYDRTLMEWHRRLDAAWETLGGRHPPAMRRLWRYYLMSCAGSFRARKNQLWQIVLSPHGVAGGYAAVR